MKTHISVLIQAILIAGTIFLQIDGASASNKVCARETAAYNTAVRRADAAQLRLDRMEQTYQSRLDAADYRLAMMSAQVEQARAQLAAIKTGAVGNGISCLFRDGNCISSGIRSITYQIARGKARVRSAEARYNAFANSLNGQLARFQNRITRMRSDVEAQKAAANAAQATLNACLSSIK